MAEQNSGKDLKKALECLEEDTLTSYVARSRTYQSIGNLLTTDNDIDPTTARRLLTVCIQDLKEDMKYAVNTLNIINLVLKKIKSKNNMTIPEVVHSAVAILGILKTTALMCKVQALPTLCFDTFLSYPDDTYVELATNYREDIMELFTLYFLRSISVILQVMPFNVLLKMLNILPPKKKREFVENGVPIWFSHLLPTVMQLMAQSQVIPSTLEALELLTEVLQRIDYSGNQEWKALMENIYSPDKYPAVMKSLLENGNNNWYRLWNVFVKLLKEQITTSKYKLGSPINSLLPVVETAFKMDIPNRVRAFHCWMVLTDNFSRESQDQFVTKRIKLLIIPLKSNNAKVEDTAIAKFDTWWNVIRKFRPKINKLIDIVFMPFLTFCFGNVKSVNDNSVNSVTVPGQFSWRLKKLCVQAFVESVGHASCEGCVTVAFPKLSEPILDPKLFVGYLADWLGVLRVVVSTCASEEYGGGGAQAVSCIWKSFILTAENCPETDKHRLLEVLLNFLSEICEDNTDNEDIMKIVMDGLIKSSFDITVLRIIGEIVHRLDRLIQIVLGPLVLYSRNNILTKDICLPLADAIVDDTLAFSPTMVNTILEPLPTNSAGLDIWSLIMECVCDVGCKDLKKLKRLLMWPLENVEHFDNENYPTSVWNAAYTKFWPQLKSAGIDNDISVVLLSKHKASSSTSLLATHALLQVLNKVLKKDSGSNYKMEAELLIKLLEKVENLESIQTVVPVVIDSLLFMMNKALEGGDLFLVESTLKIANSMIKFMNPAASDSEDDKNCVDYVEKILGQIDEYFKNTSYIKFKFLVIDELISCLNKCDKTSSINDLASCILKNILSKSDKSEVPFYAMVENALNQSEKGVAQKKNGSNDANFAPPIKAKNKKKQGNIVNKIVENGEEFVVVKSDWKFNPKKLTEQQKERLQRKREDIPALYQDLSQSQDEFRMTSWKTDSQDTSTTNSKSASRGDGDSSDILKKMSNTEVVPKIMENIFLPEKTSNENGNMDKEKRFQQIQTPSPKQKKSPRVALKDRVFQNVKNLLEKSTVSSEGHKKTEIIESVCGEDNRKQNTAETIISKKLNKTTIAGVTTPSPNRLSKNIRMELEVTGNRSAPSLISKERPSRVKRKPQKYENEYELEHKKKRESSPPSNDSQEKTAQYSQEVVKQRKSKVLHETVEKSVKEVTAVAVVHEEPKKQYSCGDAEIDKELITTPLGLNSPQSETPKKVPIVVLEQSTPEKLLQEVTAPKATHKEQNNQFCTKNTESVRQVKLISLDKHKNRKTGSSKKVSIGILEQSSPDKIIQEATTPIAVHEKPQKHSTVTSPEETKHQTTEPSKMVAIVVLQQTTPDKLRKELTTPVVVHEEPTKSLCPKNNVPLKYNASCSVENNTKLESPKKVPIVVLEQTTPEKLLHSMEHEVMRVSPKQSEKAKVNKQSIKKPCIQRQLVIDIAETTPETALIAQEDTRNTSDVCKVDDTDDTQDNISRPLPEPETMTSAKKQVKRKSRIDITKPDDKCYEVNKNLNLNSSNICEADDTDDTQVVISTPVPEPEIITSAKKQLKRKSRTDITKTDEKCNEVTENFNLNSSNICEAVDTDEIQDVISTPLPKPETIKSAKKHVKRKSRIDNPQLDDQCNEVNKNFNSNSSNICEAVDNDDTQDVISTPVPEPEIITSAKKTPKRKLRIDITKLNDKCNEVNKKSNSDSPNICETDDADDSQGFIPLPKYESVTSAKKQVKRKSRIAITNPTDKCNEVNEISYSKSHNICEVVDKDDTQDVITTQKPEPVTSAKKQLKRKSRIEVTKLIDNSNEVSKNRDLNYSNVCEVDDNDATQDIISTPLTKPETVTSDKKPLKRKSKIDVTKPNDKCDEINKNSNSKSYNICGADDKQDVNSTPLPKPDTSAKKQVKRKKIIVITKPTDSINEVNKTSNSNCSIICEADVNDATHDVISTPLQPETLTSTEKPATRKSRIEITKPDVKSNKSCESNSYDIHVDEDNDESENVVSKSEKLNSAKKPVKRQSRINKQLAINLLSNSQPEKRVTRKTVSDASIANGRKGVAEKLAISHNNTTKSDSKVAKKTEALKTILDTKDTSVKELYTAKDTEDTCSTDDIAFSEDFIESSQDSSSISVNSHKSIMKKVKVVLKQNKSIDILTENQVTKDDIEFSQNKSIDNQIQEDMTAEIDTEPVDIIELNDSDEGIILTDEPTSLIANTQEIISVDSQNTANADTQPMDTNMLEDNNVIESLTPTQESQYIPCVNLEVLRMDTPEPQNDVDAGVSSPFRDVEERNKDFLNNTLEISPIRTMSPAPIEKGSPENSNDYVVVQLSSPVHTNGEPFDRSCSPEIFTDDKLPAESEQSPPRAGVAFHAGSPSLSLKKNRPQVRQGGRGAQMLGLCVPARLNTLVTERVECEEAKRPGPSATPVRRNLRILINCAEREGAKEAAKEPQEEVREEAPEEGGDTFLQLRKSLPPADCSPAGPILKRKLAEICDDATTSPASKRKRVSFHDPPVSTTVSVHKYIEPIGVKSPQVSTAKKQERQTRPTVVKSSKKLDTMFTLDTVLTKAVESFADPNAEDTEMSSLEQTPAVEIVKTSELNDVDPIFPELIFCKDPISNIAMELSSPVMKAALIAELQGKVDTIGDLAKLTELQVNRLRIKAPKLDVAKKVLAEYASNLIDTLDETSMSKTREVVNTSMNSEVQTDALELRHADMQTDILDVSAVDTQTDNCHSVIQRSVQTIESGSKSTKDVIKTCLAQGTNFVDELSMILDDSAKVKIATGLPVADVCSVIDRSSLKTEDSQRLLDIAMANAGKAESLENLQQYLVNKYSGSDVILFCSDLLRKVHGKTTEM